MKKKEIKALISLLEDDDPVVHTEIMKQIHHLGESAIPYLEEQWENTLDISLQSRIEDVIHKLQFDQLEKRLIDWKDKEQNDLLKGMWLLATYQYPDLSLENVSAKLDQLYYEAWSNFKEDLQPMDKVRILNHVIFNKFKFSANTRSFHSPANSMINQVLESRKGNPISLCVVYMLLGQRLKMPLYGVNLPNLFILIHKEEEFSFYINVFNKGLIFSKDDIDHYLDQLKMEPVDAFYEPCSNLAIIQRVLRNLMVSFKKTGDLDKLEEVEQLLKGIS
ncbi:MAG: transglutaminase-like domain-containing protein [Cytophagales bacterium]